MAKETTKRVTAKSLILKLIIAGKTDDQVISEVQKKLPDSAVDAKHCTKYRREAFMAGDVKADKAAVHSKEHRDWAKAHEKDALKGPHKEFYKARVAKAKEAKKAKKAA